VDYLVRGERRLWSSRVVIMSGDGAVGLTFVFDDVFVVLHRQVVVAVLLMLPA